MCRKSNIIYIIYHVAHPCWFIRIYLYIYIYADQVTFWATRPIQLLSCVSCCARYVYILDMSILHIRVYRLINIQRCIPVWYHLCPGTPSHLGRKTQHKVPWIISNWLKMSKEHIKINNHWIHTSLFLSPACPLPPRNGSCNPFRIPPPPPHPHHPHHPHRDRRSRPLLLVPALAPVMVSYKVHNESQPFISLQTPNTTQHQAFPSHKESVSSHCRFIT